MNFLRRLAALFRREKLDGEMAEEMRFHLEQRAAEHIASGASPDEARYAARRKFGGVEQIAERCRDERTRGFVWLEQLAQDFRYAGRQLWRNPGFAVTAIAILALSIGATTAVFSVVHSLVWKPLPYEQPGRLVRLFEAGQPGEQSVVSPGVFLDWREYSTHFEDLAAYNGVSFNFGGADEPERISGLQMTASGLKLLRARPVLGRIFAPDEDQAGRDKVVVLSHGLWQRRFAGERDVVGRTVLINDERYTIIGVLPAGFLIFEREEFVIPYVAGADWRERRGYHMLRVLGRLKPGVTIEEAQTELDAIARRNHSLYPAWKREWLTTVVAMQEQLVQSIRPALLMLLGAVGLVLLIACANIANLLLAKASTRQKEIALRAALGAGRGRIVRQLLTESIFLSLIGAVLGLMLAYWAVEGLRHVVSAMNFPRAHNISLDGGVLGLALLVSFATGIGFGLAPAWQAARTNLEHALKAAARGSASGGNRVRGGLIVGEVALALILLVGAGLLLHSFLRLIDEPPGFEPERAATLQLSLSNQRYPDSARRLAFYNRVAERVGALPGVEAAGFARTLPLRGGAPRRHFRITNRANHPDPGYVVEHDFCTAGYFQALGIPLRRGRLFDAREVASRARVAVISEALAREYFPGEDPIGRHLGHDDLTWEIVGVVGDVRTRGLAQPAQPMLYRPEAPMDVWSSATLVVRTRGSPLAVVEALRHTIREIDPTLPIANVQTLENVVIASVAERRLTLALLAGFAGVALLLAAIGLYGVIAYSVTQRTREFGIRVALGASRHDVLGLVLRSGLKLVLAGLVLGVVGAISLSQLLTKLLYEISPTDPLTFAAVSVALLLTATMASWLPARRAAKVDPMVALRAE